MDLCDSRSPLNLADPCIRALWGAFIPGLCVLALYLLYVPVPRPVRRLFAPLKRNFAPFLTLQEAELLTTTKPTVDDEVQEHPDAGSKSYKQVSFILFGVMEVLYWLSRGCYLLVSDLVHWWLGARALSLAFVWLYTVVRHITHPPRTAPYTLLAVYASLLIGWLVELGGVFYDHTVYGVPLPSLYATDTFSIQLCVIVGMLSVVLSMPLAIPGNRSHLEGAKRLSEDYTTLWGWVAFRWIYPLLKNRDDPRWSLSPTLQSRPLFIKFHQISRPTLLRKILASISLDLILALSLTCASVCLNYAGPFFLRHILEEIDHESSSPSSKSKAYIYAFLAFISALAKTEVNVQRFWFSHRASVRVRSELMAALYDKALKVKNRSDFVARQGPVDSSIGDDHTNKPGTDVGKTLNLMSDDVNTVSDMIANIHVLCGAPLEILVASIFLYHLLGWNAFAGFLVLPIIAPLSFLLLKRGSKINDHLSKAKDKRMGLLSEVLMAIKYIKLLAEEDLWAGRVSDERECELGWMKKAWFNTFQLNFLWGSVPILVSIISLWAYVAQGNVLSISTIFTAITLFNMIQQPLGVLPATLEKMIRVGHVALERISAYLLGEEDSARLVEDTNTSLIDSSDEDLDGLGFVKASFTWSNEQSSASIALPTNTPPDTTGPECRFELRELDVRFPEGRVTIVDGPTGSGKSALLLALLGEMTLTAGRVLLSRQPAQMDAHGLKPLVSYSPQDPWLRMQTIKDNILFGHPYEESRYHEVIDACALQPDLDQMDEGDATEVGARGITLSGGQKTRVGLARAIYARTKYVLLDDPLSTIDIRTARTLYERLLRGPLLAHRTVVLVTRQVELVRPSAHYFVQMLNGRIDVQNTVENLLSQSFWDQENIPRTGRNPRRHPFKSNALAGTPSRTPAEFPLSVKAKIPHGPLNHKLQAIAKKKWSAGRKYFTISSLWPWISLVVALILRELIVLGEKLWIKNWGEASGSFRGTWPDPSSHPYFYLSVFASMGFGHMLIDIISVNAEHIGASRTADALFRHMFTAIVEATLRFHDTTSQGRILKIFTRDLDTVDTSLAKSIHNVGASLVGIVTSIGIILVVFPGFLIPAFFIGYGYFKLARVYLNASRSFRRKEADTRSPILSDFNEVLEGSVTIRAFSAGTRLMNDMHEKIDSTTKMWHMFWMTNRWLLFNFDCLGGLAVLVTTLFAIPTPKEGAAWAAVCITSAMAFTNSVYWGCRFSADLGLDFSSVEQIAEYMDLPMDPPKINAVCRAPSYWPSIPSDTPLLVVDNLTVQYAPNLAPALRNVSLTLKAGERVALLGHTGCGKSTLATSILRLVEPSAGKIVIDGIDTSTIGLHDLRSKITFVPQDPPFFSGNLRNNLDPFGRHDDRDYYEVLQRVQLITQDADPRAVLSGNKEIDLDMFVAPGGANFSQGEKQLLSLARALLRRSAIIIFDESTCGVDTETETKVRQVLREELEGRLLISVVHRLRHVMDYDRLIIMDKGSIAEFDTPWNLIQRKDGLFRDFCLKSDFFDELEAIAKDKIEPLVEL